MDKEMLSWLSRVGLSQAAVVPLRTRTATVRHMPYLDLLSAGNGDELLPDAAIEVDGRPVMYLIYRHQLGRVSVDNIDLLRLLNTLACRADARFLGVIEPGRLQIYPIGLTQVAPSLLTELNIEEASLSLHDFLTGQVDALTPVRKGEDIGWLDGFLFELLMSCAKRLREAAPALSNGQVLSLMGRALFTRFLADRGIIKDSDAAAIAPRVKAIEELLSTPMAAASTFLWLDQTFNGDLLPLETDDYPRFFTKLDATAPAVCKLLTDILYRAPQGQLELGWKDIQFRHVPVDVLSQVYEHFAHAFQAGLARSTSIHYTPRHIAQQLLDAAFTGHESPRKGELSILDPAAGAGVFLVLGFRRLVQERWRESGRRPDRRTIRAILNRQLCGFDINAEALKFAALSLYLTALELDPRPTPLEDLAFTKLAGKVLIDVSPAYLGNASDAELGSLSKALPEEFNNRFDIVVGNPPWTSIGRNFAPALTAHLRCLAQARCPDDASLSTLINPDQVPDLVFFWRATEWAKQGGMLAFALHARLLFKQGEAARVRAALFRLVKVTGVLNGAALRKAGIWPGISAPSCLLVARNEMPSSDSSFFYLSPLREQCLNARGQFRLDPLAAIQVPTSSLQDHPFLFKSLFRGSQLDVDLVARLQGEGRVRLADYWRTKGLHQGDGFQRANGKKDASHLKGFAVLEVNDEVGRVLTEGGLRRFPYARLHRIRDERIYRAPLVIFRGSPPADRNMRGALRAKIDVCFSEAFFGYSCHGHPKADLLAQYLQLISWSDLFLYHALMTSSQFGVERDALQKEDIDGFPLVPLESLSRQDQAKMRRLASAIERNEVLWGELDNWVANLYGLSGADQQLIRDTLSVSLPYTGNLSFAEAPPTQSAVEDFLGELERLLQPFVRRMGVPVWTRPEPALSTVGWCYMRVGFSLPAEKEPMQRLVPELVSTLADRFWVSQVRVHLGVRRGELLIGQLAQNRYWTVTKARLLALDLLRSDLERHG